MKIEDPKTKYRKKPEDMSSVTTSTATHSTPCILSCGYKSICIPKSGLEFPAWLVCFDTESDNEQEQGGVADYCY
jgi:hypothetical protein